jgi:hypothetical protein
MEAAGKPSTNRKILEQKGDVMVEAAGVELSKQTHHQQLGRFRLAQGRQIRSKRWVEVQIRYTKLSP